MKNIFMSLSNEQRQKALAEANSLNIGYSPVDPQQIGLLIGIQSIFADYKPAISKKLAGYVSDEDSIYINRALSGHEMIFTIAHEIGIVVLKLNRERTYSKKDCLNPFNATQSQEDLLATYFAIHLLIPENELSWMKNSIATDRRNGYFFSMQKYADCFACKEEILLYRLNNG